MAPKAKCYLCKSNDPTHGGRCNDCNSLHVRIRTSSQKIKGFDEFNKIAPEKKETFYKDNHDACGKELKALIEETIYESVAEKEMEAWIADGKYLDKEDITAKYEKKPEQLKSIFEKTRTHFCDVRNCMLYEDPEFKSKRTSTVESTRDVKRQISCEKTSKAAKVAKVVKEEGEDAALTRGSIAALNKDIVAMAASSAILDALMKEAKETTLANFVAAPIVAKCAAAVTNMDAQKSLVELVLENNMGDFATITKDTKEAKAEAVAAAKIMRAQLMVAKSLLPADTSEA